MSSGLCSSWLVTAGSVQGAVAKADTWLLTFSKSTTTAVVVVFGPLLVLVGLIAAVLVHFGLPQMWKSARRPLQVGALLGACIAAAWFIGT